MLIKLLIGLFLIIHPVSQAIFAGNHLPCGSSTGNSLIPSTTPGLPPGRTYNVSVGSACDYFVPDMRIFWMSRTGRGWRQFGSIRQIPAPGTRVVLPPGGCANQTVQVTLTVDFHFNNGTPVNPRDDRYCSVDLLDRFMVEDKIPPVARSIAISTGNTDFSAGALKSLFTASAFTDNCTPLSTLQNNLEFVTDPRRPAIAEIRCGSTNTHRVAFRTRDACGNVSNWAIATVTFRDILAPQNPEVFVGVFTLDATCQVRIRTGTTLPPPGGYLPNTLYVRFYDDYTPLSDIRYSFRIISPSSLIGDIPAAGRVINRAGSCPAGTEFTVRVCAQDCFGNGNLYIGNNSTAGVGSNCVLYYLNIVDTTRPLMVSSCGDTSDLFSDLNCQAVMPNLAASLAWSDGCTAASDLTVYQFPAPGSILNDGVDDEVGLAMGPSRPYSCAVSKPADPIAYCGNTLDLQTLKIIPVHFVVVDCDGNCTVVEGCRYIDLVKSAGAVDPLIARGLKGLPMMSTNNLKKESDPVRASHYPNPFHEFTEIKIQGLTESSGMLHFYSIQGQKIYSAKFNAADGSATVRVQRADLPAEGLVIYQLEFIDPRSGRVRSLTNKLMIQ